jgi:hypothetical protein
VEASLRSKTLAAVVCATAVFGTTATAPAVAAPPAATAAESADSGGSADFNGDGYPDLGITAPTVDVDGVDKAGAFAVVYGSASGLRYDNASVINQSSPGVPGEPATDRRWTSAATLDSGDLNNDGYDDLLLHGIYPNPPLIFWGGQAGIVSSTSTTMPGGDSAPDWPRCDIAGVEDANGDGLDDIVCASDLGAHSASIVSVLSGPFDRTTGHWAKAWHRDVLAQDGMQLSAVGFADTTGDGLADLLISGRRNNVTVGQVLKGSPAGPVKSQDLSGNEVPFLITPSIDAVGDLNKDGYADVATGWPSLSQVQVIFGGPDGVSTTLAPRIINQDTPGVPGIEEDGDAFGHAVAITDTDADGYADLVIGVSGETATDAATTFRSGAVTVVRGSATGLATTGGKTLTQNSKGVPSTSENYDRFGTAISAIDTDHDGNPEVYVGGHGEDGFTGRVWKLLIGSEGLTGTDSTSFNLGTLGGPKGGYFGDQFSS